MVPKPSTLVVVAYPMDEIWFSTVCVDADVVIVGDKYKCGCSRSPTTTPPERVDVLGARTISYLELASERIGTLIHHYSPCQPAEDSHECRKLEQRLGSLGSYELVYTHHPLDYDGFRQAVALLTSRVFKRVLVPAIGAAASQVYPLSQDLLLRKVAVVNRHYSEGFRGGGGCSLSYGAPLGVEAFAQLTHDDIMRGIAVNSGAILDYPDEWGFTTSPYERSRLSTSCQLLVEMTTGVNSILEVGACEGEMTQQLRSAFPDATVRAVEPHPLFANKLTARFCNDPLVEIVNAYAWDVPLEADVVVLTETIYYMSDAEATEALKCLSAKYLLVSNGRPDAAVSQQLLGLGWCELGYRDIPPTIEPVDGKSSPLLSLRRGTIVRLWGR